MIARSKSRRRAHAASLAFIEPMEPRLLLSGLTEYPTQSVQPIAVAVAPDNTMWVAHAQGHTVTHMSSAGAVLQSYDTGDFGDVWDIAVGQDGTVWFAEAVNSVVGRLNPTTGHIDNIAVPVNIVNHVAVGSDGALWYTDTGLTTVGTTDYFDPSIGRIDPVTLAVGTPINLGHINTAATAIKVKGDDIWVSLGGQESDVYDPDTDTVTPDYGNGAFVHVSISSGVVTGYDSPVLASTVSDVLPQTDGSVWITLADDQNRPDTIEQEGVYHITFSGATANVTQSVLFDNSTDAHLPQNLVLAPDGKLYFSLLNDKMIDNLDTTTLAVTNATTTTGYPWSLTLGPSSAGAASQGLWFAESDTNLLGVYDLPQVTEVTPVIAAGVPQIQQVQNVALPPTRVATFTGPGVAADYSATVNWGDGSPTILGTVSVLPSGGFQVTAGGRSFANEATYTITVGITNNLTSQSATATSSLKITDTPLALTSFAVNPLILRIALLTATFTDDLSAVAGNFKVTINWGDGSSDAGVTVKLANGVFGIADLHRFKHKGTFTVTLRVDPLNGVSDAGDPIISQITITV